MTRNPVQLALLLCFLGVSTSPAEGLVWERTCIRITAQPGQRVVRIRGRRKLDEVQLQQQ